METVYKMHDLKTHLSRLVKQVDKGGKIVFGVGGNPDYVITRFVPKSGMRGVRGMYKNRARVEPDLGGWTKEELESFEAHDPLISH